jgi:hypothetical protein
MGRAIVFDRMMSSQTDGPVGNGAYVVQAGDCIGSIADAHGHFWQTIWNHPDNGTLKQARVNPNILLPGDRVTVPELQPKHVACATGRKHVFRRRGVPEVLRLAFADGAGGPLAGKRYRLVVDGVERTGTTRGDGSIEEWIAPAATSATLQLWPETAGLAPMLQWSLRVGGLDPASSMNGVKTRLRNLGFSCGPAGEELDAATRTGLEAFQVRHGLEATGEADDATRKKLAELHDGGSAGG